MKYLLYIAAVAILTGVSTSCTKKVKPNFLEGKWKVVSLIDEDNPENNKSEDYFKSEPMTYEFMTEDNKYGQKELFVYKNGEMGLCYYEIVNNSALDVSDDETGRESRVMLINKIDNKTFELRKSENSQTLKIVRQ
ncbi:MAG: hypothetical protein ACPGU5_07755 [Lishizhenia sp.]